VVPTRPWACLNVRQRVIFPHGMNITPLEVVSLSYLIIPTKNNTNMAALRSSEVLTILAPLLQKPE